MVTSANAEITVCLVDDNSSIRTSLRRFFEACCFTVRDYPSGESFLADMRIKERGCLIVDFHLPGSDGLEILRELRSRGFFMPVIMLTGDQNSAVEERAMRLGASAFFRKPADLYSLVSKVVEAVRSARDNFGEETSQPDAA
jgi:two-component system response regulator FixJ